MHSCPLTGEMKGSGGSAQGRGSGTGLRPPEPEGVSKRGAELIPWAALQVFVEPLFPFLSATVSEDVVLQIGRISAACSRGSQHDLGGETTCCNLVIQEHDTGQYLHPAPPHMIRRIVNPCYPAPWGQPKGTVAQHRASLFISAAVQGHELGLDRCI